MNLTLVASIALIAFASDSNAQFGPSPFANFFSQQAATNPGWLIGQESSKNAVNIAINNALSNLNVTALPPELQVTSFFTKISIFFLGILKVSQID